MDWINLGKNDYFYNGIKYLYILKELDSCTLCPRMCKVNRNAGEKGYCGCGSSYDIASVCLHQGEEPAISGKKGICNVFFSGCNMQCVFCQNFQISRRRGRKEIIITPEEITEKITDILDSGVEAIGFVSPTHFVPHVRAIMENLHNKGYKPTIVYNTNGFDNIQIIKDMEGLIDVYLPDFKYLDPALAKEYSDTSNYPDVIKAVLKEMYRQKGSTLVINDEGQAVTGLIIRHLVLPGHSKDSIQILEWIARELSTSVHISLMSQYYPTVHVRNHTSLGKALSQAEYQEVLDTMEYLGFYNGWTQDYESTNTYRPDFKKLHPFGE
jgi:putative pyruvate formate lyase activating enzyme